MNLKILKFEWDPNKEALNIKKHMGISFELAKTVFNDPHALMFDDIDHSTEREKRYYRIGKCSDDRILTVWFTLRKDTIRIIGCAEYREYRRIYNEKTKI